MQSLIQPKDPEPSKSGLRAGLKRRVAGAWRSLVWRLVVTLTASLLLILGFTGWQALNLHRKHLLSVQEEHAIVIGETILSSSRSAMLRNDTVHLAQIFESVGRPSTWPNQ